MQKCPFTVEYIMLYLIYYVYNRLLIERISMTRKKINKLSIILLLSMLLLPFFDLPHVDIFSNEDLDNILRRMEGLTTDEKEAYLDARLKELESLPDSRKKELQEAARTGMKRTLELASHISVMNELQRIGNIVSFASIAKDYFGKSKFWIHQRINGYLVNGKPACFTNEQIVRMAEALEDIAKQMQEAAAHLKVIATQERSTVKKLETGKE